MNNCTGCHAGANARGNLDMSTQAKAYTNLVGVKASGPACGSKMETRVVKGSSATSLLYTKVSGNPDCGVPMPANGGSLAAADIATIQGWIDSGAPNN